MLNQEQFYSTMARIDHQYGMMFLTVAVVMLALAHVQPRRWIDRSVFILYPGAWFYWLGAKVFKPPRRFWLWLWVLAVVLRLPGMQQSFWYDESFTGAIARLPFEHVTNAIMGDVHPPLPYLMFWLAGRLFGLTEFGLRLPSFALGLFSIYLFYRIARHYFNEPTARAAALILVCLPTHIYYSTEARAYMLLVVLVFVSLLAILEDRPDWFLAASALGWTHAHGHIYSGALAITALYWYRKEELWRAAIRYAVLVSAAWIPFMLQQAQDVENGFWLWELTPGGMLWFLVDQTVSQRLTEAGFALAYIPIMAVTVGSVWALWRSSHQWSNRVVILWAGIAIGVPVVTAAISILWRPVYLTRALFPAALLFVLLWAWLVMRSESKRIYRALLIPALAIAVIDSGNYHKKDLRSVFDLCRGADSVYAMSTAVGVMASYYADVPIYLRPYGDDLNQSISASGKRAFGLEEREFSQLSGQVCVVSQTTALSNRFEEHVYLHGRVLNHDVLWMETPLKAKTYWLRVYMVMIDDQ